MNFTYIGAASGIRRRKFTREARRAVSFRLLHPVAGNRQHASRRPNR
jgi:hypothetical protein